MQNSLPGFQNAAFLGVIRVDKCVADVLDDLLAENQVDGLVDQRQADAVVHENAILGGAENFDGALSIVRRRGTVVLVAGYYKPLEVDLSRWYAGQTVLTVGFFAVLFGYAFWVALAGQSVFKESLFEQG